MLSSPAELEQRFATARKLPACRAALDDDWTPPSTSVATRMIAMTVILVAFVGFLAIVKPFAAIVAGSVSILAIAVMAIELYRDRHAPIERKLAIIVSMWTATNGMSREVERISHTVTLRDELGDEREYRLATSALGDAFDNAIGIATIRSGRVLRFVQL